MDFTSTYEDRADEIIALFTSTFTDSEGAAEGQVIKKLVTDMFATVGETDMHVFSSIDGGAVVGSIVFSRMTYPEDARTVFVLAPVAVATDRQGQGVGQKLLRHGLDSLRDKGVDVALTYGDINYYARVGFRQIGADVAQPPMPLQYPEGWMGQSLNGEALVPLKGPSRCVEALNDPAYW